MSLIDEMMTDCVIMDKRTTEDGDGGTDDIWVPGAKIRAAITNDSSTLAKIAEHEGVTGLFKITTYKNVKLRFPDVVKRLSDGQVFRVTSDGNDVASPDAVSFNISQVSAEKWRLT